MGFVADESVDQPIASRLRADGHYVEAVSELSPGITDDEVLFLTTDQGAVLLTADKGFGELVFPKKPRSLSDLGDRSEGKLV